MATSRELPPERAAAAESGSGYASFRYRDFRLYIVGRALGQASHQMLLVAVGYQIYDQTGDPISLALVNLTMIAPVFACFLFTGYIADQFDRGRVLTLCYAVMTAATLLLCLFSSFGLPISWKLYAILLGIGTARAIYAPTSNAFIPVLVPQEVLTNAIAWNASLSKLMQICAPAAGGFAYLLGPEYVYAMAALAFLVSAATSAMMRPRPASAMKAPLGWPALLAGFRYVFESKIILGVIVVDFLVVFMGTVPPMLPIFAKDILDVGPAGAGILRSAIGGGGLLAALAIAHISVGERAGAKMLWAAALFGAAIIVFGLSTSFLLSTAALVLVGAADMVNVTVRHTLLQVATPDSLRGRVSAANSLSSNSGSELGGFRAGLFAAALGPVSAVVLGGVVVVALAVGSFKLFPALARVDRLDRREET